MDDDDDDGPQMAFGSLNQILFSNSPFSSRFYHTFEFSFSVFIQRNDDGIIKKNQLQQQHDEKKKTK